MSGCVQHWGNEVPQYTHTGHTREFYVVNAR